MAISNFKKRYQQHVYKIAQPIAYTSLASDNQPMGSLEHQTRASSFEHQTQTTTEPAYTTPTYAIAQLDSFENASSTTETWGILVDTGAATSVAPKSFASDIELSPAPSTLQLTTATGKAVETYGLGKVHLQSQGLSLEVSFVIADVVTPLLGLDIMIKDSLSLRVEHDLQHVLVNPAGDRTKLEHMGRHLYMIACPSQHGLSPCFIGNLSQVIGFLPADKELHEQKLASRSSSSTDIDEDTCKQQVEQDSLNFQCQHVLPATFDEKDDLSFDVMSSKEEVADSGGELQATSFLLYPCQQSEQPSAQERELHNMNHIYPQHGCGVGQETKGKASTKTSNIQLQYAYMRQPQDKEPTMILTWVESLTGMSGSLMPTEKEPTPQQLDAGKQTSLPTRQSPAYNHQLAAWQSSLFTQFRALLFDFCGRYKLQPSDVKIGSSLSQHVLRHAEWLLNRFQLHVSNNKTSFQRRWGTAYSKPVLPFGELVLAQDQSLAIWLGRCEASDDHILAKANSNSLVKSKSVTRLSLESSMDIILFTSISLPPPELASAAYLKMAQLGDQPVADAGGERELRMAYPPHSYIKHPQQKAKERQPRFARPSLATTSFATTMSVAAKSFAPTSCATTSFSNNSFDQTRCRTNFEKTTF